MQPHTPSKPIDHTTREWRLFLAYDIGMLVLILINLLILAAHYLFTSAFGNWIAHLLDLQAQHLYYQQHFSNIVQRGDFYFICFLITELSIRWIVAIINKHHRRWWFFPFIHWYEVLAILPFARFLRLLRVGVIAYRLSELGYQVIPTSVRFRLKFYYDLVMEELTDRIILTVLAQVEREMNGEHGYGLLIQNIVQQHRSLFADILAETLQEQLANELKTQQGLIQSEIGHIVAKSIQDTPELHQLLKLIPFLGGTVEQLITRIGIRFSENITQGILQHLTQSGQPTNPLYQHIAKQVSQIPIESEKIDQLTTSILESSFEGIRQQLKIKHWQLVMDNHHRMTEALTKQPNPNSHLTSSSP